ncbi:MAG: MmgE/PrpD family protein [Granulosicoccaceae bacterium]
MSNPSVEFIHSAKWANLPASTQLMAKQCLLDLLGVAASGTRTHLSRIISDHAAQHFAAGDSGRGARLLFDGRSCSPAGASLSNGMTIDSIDAHDGHKPTKGHAGCGVLPAVLAILDSETLAANVTEEELLTCIVVGYEIACRAGIALHASVPDYHTSGAWVALAAAAIGARILKLSEQQTREALGIAEYHGPRSQMMRCIDHPTMLKDGSGWGAMAGVSAAYLAQSGFTGAPAITMESAAEAPLYKDLGSNWLISEQYFKPYPVCRWAQPAIVAAMRLQAEHNFDIADISMLSIGTFHESGRLATAIPTTTEQAQYSLPFPVAAALKKRQLTVTEIEGDGLADSVVLKLSKSIELHEVEAYNNEFPARRISDVTITLHNGCVFESGPTEADGDPESPLSSDEMTAKYFRFAAPVLGEERSRALADRVGSMGNESRNLDGFYPLIYTAGAS